MDVAGSVRGVKKMKGMIMNVEKSLKEQKNQLKLLEKQKARFVSVRDQALAGRDRIEHHLNTIQALYNR